MTLVGTEVHLTEHVNDTLTQHDVVPVGKCRKKVLQGVKSLLMKLRYHLLLDQSIM